MSTRAGQTKQGRLVQLGVISAAALFIVVALIVVSQSGGHDGSSVEGGSEAAAIFSGIPQDGKLLGRPDAKVTMSEFGDLQCPFCAQYATNVLPDLVDRYVRTGQVRMEFAVVRVLGPDSDTAGRAAVAAGLQDKLWQFAEVFYRSQGTENSGYVTEQFIRDVAEAVPGLDVDRLLRDMDKAQVERAIVVNETRAHDLGLSGTPTFFAGRRGQTQRKLEPTALEPSSFTGPLDRLIGR